MTRNQATEWLAGGKSGGDDVYLTFYYKGGQKLDEQEMERLGGFLVRKVSAAVSAGA